MIYLDCQNEFLKKNLFDLFRQLSLDYLFEEKKENSPFSITIFFQEQFLKITSNEISDIKMYLPLRLDQIIDTIEKVSKKFFINIANVKYYPLNQSILFGEKIMKLNLIHNKILMQLSLHKNGLPKSYLYKLIWPMDKEYSVNKLDTHITNLKNSIIEETKLNINFESNNGVLKLII